MLPPAIEVGELPLTAFWSLLETPRAHCSVSAFWIPSWKPPAPPQPARQPCPPSRWSLPSQPQLEPTFCSSCWSWSVLELLETSVVAVEVAVWSAVDGPLLTSPPAIDTGTFAFTAVWWLLEIPTAACWVVALWRPAWKPPAPPEPPPPPASAGAGAAARATSATATLSSLALISFSLVVGTARLARRAYDTWPEKAAQPGRQGGRTMRLGFRKAGSGRTRGKSWNPRMASAVASAASTSGRS